MSRPRIAVVFPLGLVPQHRGKDIFLIPEGLSRMGFDVELHCAEAVGDDWPIPVHVVGWERLLDADHWRSRNLAGAIVFSFLRFSRLVAAITAARVPVVAKSDTTGKTIARVHPRETFTRARYDEASPSERVGHMLAWLARVGPLYRREADELVRVVGAADHTIVESVPARDAVLKVLERRHEGTLAQRVTVVPNPVAECFLRADLPTTRDRRVVAIGDWDLKVKDAGLLVKAIERFRRKHPAYEVVVVGSGGESVFAQHEGCGFTHAGRLPQTEIAGLLCTSRVVLSTSHWESFSLSSHEGLATGCTVVGPALGPIVDITSAGPYGTVAARRTPDGLADALALEAATWDRGDRDPVGIATFWRERLSIERIAETFAKMLLPSGAVTGYGERTPPGRHRAHD